MSLKMRKNTIPEKNMKKDVVNCKAIKNDGGRCNHPACFKGYCMIHYHFIQKKKNEKKNEKLKRSASPGHLDYKQTRGVFLNTKRID